MRKVQVQALPEDALRSPKGTFAHHTRDVSEALGRQPDSNDVRLRHPFDVMLARVPPGASYCPYHSHSAQTEFYLVLQGTGEARDAAGRHPIAAGEAFLFQPGEAHQIINTGEEDLLYYVIADNPFGDSCHYPDSEKVAVRVTGGERQLSKLSAAQYLDGEE